MSRALEHPELIVYGGAFDPPHASHVACVGRVCERFPVARIVVMPAPAPAGANGYAKAPIASFPDRLAMCEKAFGHFGHRVDVSALESELPAPSFTINTLRLLKAREGRRLALLIGQDQLDAFATWKEPAQILRLAGLVVMARPKAPTDIRASVTRLAAAVGTNLEWTEDGLSARLPGLGSSIFALAQPVGDAASRVVRERFASRQPPPDGWLLPAVETYIRDHHLYGT